MPDIFSVIADGTRRDLLGALLAASTSEAGHRELSVGELVVRLGLTQPTVSKHLRVLRDAGLVGTREEGQHRYYRLEPEPLRAIDEWLEQFAGVADADADDALTTTSWTPDGQPVSVRRPTRGGRAPADVGLELGRVIAEASFRATSAFSGAQSGLGRVVEPVRRRLGRRPEGGGE